MIHKDLPKAHHPRNLEVSEWYDSSSLSSKVLTLQFSPFSVSLNQQKICGNCIVLGPSSKGVYSDILKSIAIPFVYYMQSKVILILRNTNHKLFSLMTTCHKVGWK